MFCVCRKNSISISTKNNFFLFFYLTWPNINIINVIIKILNVKIPLHRYVGTNSLAQPPNEQFWFTKKIMGTLYRINRVPKHYCLYARHTRTLITFAILLLLLQAKQQIIIVSNIHPLHRMWKKKIANPNGGTFTTPTHDYRHGVFNK